VRDAEALTRLCLVLALTPLSLVAQGTQVVASQKRRWVDPPWGRGTSYLRIGWQWVKPALARGWELFAQLRWSGAPDPDPARASASQALPPPPVTFTQTFCYAPLWHCQLNGLQPNMTTTYCGHDFLEYPILYYFTFS
jgi:hypothetical protein